MLEATNAMISANTPNELDPIAISFGASIYTYVPPKQFASSLYSVKYYSFKDGSKIELVLTCDVENNEPKSHLYDGIVFE